MNPLIETRDLCRRFGRLEAVAGLDLCVPQGSAFALLGPNGAGKTTTIQLLMNILEPSGGRATVFGKPSTRLGPAEFQRIGHVSENQKLPDWMRLGEFLDHCRAMYPQWDREYCRQLLEQFTLPLDRKLHQLSRGMRMKAALLSSLAYRPRLLVLDEPFSGLDPGARDEFIAAMLSLVGASDWTLLISSHDIEEVGMLVDWVGYLDRGRLVFQEPVESLLGRFRRVEASLENAAAPPVGHPPLLPPTHWLQFRRQAHGVTFVDSLHAPETILPNLAALGFKVTNWQAHPMTLREIFVALSRRLPSP
jgi:ABC-2 type transport system ATP-binding protein